MTSEQNEVIFDYLSGKYASREAGQKLGFSHQGFLNMLPKWMRDNVMDGKLKLQWKENKK